MRIPRLPVALLSMATVFSMATMGVSYTLWADVLEVNGTVSTGIVDAHMSLHEVDQGVYTNNNTNDDAEFEGKDVGECSAQLLSGAAQGILGGGNQGNPPGFDVDTGPDKVEITITNGYPSFWCYVEIDVHNVGSIPIKLFPLVLNDILVAGVPVVTIDTLNCWASGTQLHTNEEATCVVALHVVQEASENTTYSFVTQFQANQWNEFP